MEEVKTKAPKAKPIKSPVAQALALVTTQVTQFGTLEAGFAVLETRYANVVYDVTTTKGMEDAKKARQEIRQVRYNAQALLKEAKAPLNTLKEQVTETADKIIERILKTEEPIDAQIKAEEDRKAAEKAERERLEAEAKAKVQAAVDGIGGFVQRAAGKTSEEITALTVELQALPIDLDTFGDRAGEAAELKDEVLAILADLLEKAKASELAAQQLAAQAQAQAAEAQRLANERKLLDAERAEIQAGIDAQRKALQDQQAAINAQAEKLREEAEAPARAAAAAAAAAEQATRDAEARRLLDEAAARQKAMAEAARKDAVLRDAAKPLLIALLALVNEEQPLGIERQAYQNALAAIELAGGNDE